MAEVQLKTVKPMTVMSLSFTGPYNQSSDKRDELVAWLLRAGHPYSAPPLCIYYDDPAQVPEDKLRAETCVPVAERCDGDPVVQRKSLPGGQFACITHKGAYNAMRPIYDEIFQWMGANGYQYIQGAGVREMFHKVMGQVNTVDELVTEVQVPVEKAK